MRVKTGLPNLRKSARGKPCTLLLPGCQPGPGNETVVLCHRKGGGMGMKSDDTNAVYGCYSCHTKLDGAESDLPESYDVIFERALKLTRKLQPT